MKLILSLLLVVFSLVGIADSSYLTYEKVMGIVPPCTAGFNCDAVLTSEWASIGPVPLSALGLLFYTTVFVLAVANVVEFDSRPLLKKVFGKYAGKYPTIQLITTQELLLLLTILGFFFSLYLLLLMGVIIESWCSYCLISAASSSLLFITMSTYYASSSEESPFLLKRLSFAKMHFAYTKILKPLLFFCDPEWVHNTMTDFGSRLGSYQATRAITRALFSFTHPITTKKINGITFSNQVGLAAGFDYNGELTQILPSAGFGFHTIGTVTLEAYDGNPKPRLGRLPDSQALIVNKGFKSWGALAVIKKLQSLQLSIPTGISIGSTNKFFSSTAEQILDILTTFTLFEKSKLQHKYYELNISCPNTSGGSPFTTPERLKQLMLAFDKLRIARPVYVKMPIDQSEEMTIALLEVLSASTVSGVIFGNLTKDKANPAVTSSDRKQWQLRQGNLSGKPTWERSNACIALTKKHFGKRFTIIGTGGIFSAADALKKQALGADLVQLITGMIFEGPQLIGEVVAKQAERELLHQTLNKSS